MDVTRLIKHIEKHVLLLAVLDTIRFARVTFTCIAVWRTSFFGRESPHLQRAYVGAAFSRMNQVAEIRPSVGK